VPADPTETEPDQSGDSSGRAREDLQKKEAMIGTLFSNSRGHLCCVAWLTTNAAGEVLAEYLIHRAPETNPEQGPWRGIGSVQLSHVVNNRVTGRIPDCPAFKKEAAKFYRETLDISIRDSGTK